MADIIGTTVIGIILIILVLVAAYGTLHTINYIECAKWANVNPDHNIEFHFLLGCLYETPEGLWVESSNIVYIPDKGLLPLAR